MSFSVGIVGLPNVGKSTLFKALTKQAVDISNYPFCTIDPNVGVVAVPDERLTAISQVIKPLKITPTVIEFVDIAGLVKNAHQGEGLGNQFLARIREVDAICQVVRAFENDKITHIEGRIDPLRDIEIVNKELLMKDLETLNKHLEKIQKQARAGDKKSIEELEILTEIKKDLEQGSFGRDFGSLTPKIWELNSQIQIQMGFLFAKPMIYVFNLGANNAEITSPLPHLNLNLQSEAEISELSEQEQKELDLPASQLNQLIKAAYQVLDLITFYTIKGGQETRAWTLKKGLKAPQAGGVVHSDFEEKFIRAEVINWQKLVETGAWAKAREKGLIRTEGKEYMVQDGDVIEFKI